MADEHPDYQPIFKRLLEYYTMPEALEWINSEHPQLDLQLPVDLIRQGRAKEVHAVLDRLDDCVYI